MPAARTFTSLAPVDLRQSIGGYSAGGADPSIALDPDSAWLALRTSAGPATLHFTGGATITAEAWGPGADLALERAPDICGATDDPAGFASSHPVVARMLRQYPGVRITRSAAVVEALLRMITGQRVTGTEARNGYFRMCSALGGPAPGPRRLTLPPDPALVAASAYTAFHPWGIERGRATFLVAQTWCAFLRAIREGRECAPNFRDKLKIHRVWDAAEESVRSKSWQDVDYSGIS